MQTTYQLKVDERLFRVQRWEPETPGPGPAVVLVHASGLGTTEWTHLAPHLGADHPVYAIQLLGYPGSSALDDATYQVQRDVDGVSALVGSLRTPPHVVGHSFGGFLALRAAMEAPVASLCLLEPVCYGLLTALGDRAAFDDVPTGLDPRSMLDESVGGGARWLEGFIDYWNGPGAWKALPRSRQEAYLAVGRKIFREVQGIWVNETPPDRYASIDAPTTLAISEHTTAGARRVGEVLHDLVSTTRIREVAGHGHLFPVLDPVGTLELVREHLQWAERDAGTHA